MTRFLVVLVAQLLIVTCTQAQITYHVTEERPKEKTYKGIISREILLADTSFKWYAENQKGYTANAKAVAGLKKNADSIELLVFMGTWCEDSHMIIPKFFNLLDAAGMKEEKVTLIGVDRAKTTSGHLTSALNVKNVPTIIVMKNGKEVGRVVEYGKYGAFDLELAEILNSIQ